MVCNTITDQLIIDDAVLKSYSVWDQTKYYNIWLISEIDNLTNFIIDPFVLKNTF